MQNDLAYAGTVIWGLTAVHFKQRDEYNAVGFATLVCNSVLCIAMVIVGLRELFPHCMAGAARLTQGKQTHDASDDQANLMRSTVSD